MTENNVMLTWLRNHTPAERKELAIKAETSVQYLYQIGSGHRSPSRKKAELIEYASGFTIDKMKLLFPEDYV